MEKKNVENVETTEAVELTPEQMEAIEQRVLKMQARITKGKKIWKKIKTPLVITGSAVAGFVVRGLLTQEECDYESDEDYEDDFDQEDEDD